MSDGSTPRELLTPAVLHILLALSEGRLHGYGIKEWVEERTDGALRLGPGTLYEAIHRLEADGWIEEVATPEGADGRRKYYALTRDGRTEMETELSRLDQLVSFARGRDLIPERR